MARTDSENDDFLGRALRPKDPDYNREVPFDYDELRATVDKLQREEGYWDELHARWDTETFDIVYEDFLEDREGTVRRILDFLQIDTAGKTLDFREHMAKLSNEINEAFYRRYRDIESGRAQP